MRSNADRKLWCAGGIVLVMGFLPLASSYYPPLTAWIWVLEPALALLAMGLFNSALNHYLAHYRRK